MKFNSLSKYPFKIKIFALSRTTFGLAVKMKNLSKREIDVKLRTLIWLKYFLEKNSSNEFRLTSTLLILFGGRFLRSNLPLDLLLTI